MKHVAAGFRNADSPATECRVGYSTTAPVRDGPETGERFPDDVATASLRARNQGARKAPHLQRVNYVAFQPTYTTQHGDVR